MQPPALSLRHGIAKRIFSLKSRPFESTLLCRERSCRVLLPAKLGQLARNSQQEPKPVLEIVRLGFPKKPGPIEVRIPEQHPRQRLDDARVDLRSPEDPQEQLGWIQPAPAAQVCEPRVSESAQRTGCLVRCQRGGIRAHRQSAWRQLQKPDQPFGQPARHPSATALQQTDVDLRNAEPGCELFLRPSPFTSGLSEGGAGHDQIIT